MSSLFNFTIKNKSGDVVATNRMEEIEMSEEL